MYIRLRRIACMAISLIALALVLGILFARQVVSHPFRRELHLRARQEPVTARSWSSRTPAYARLVARPGARQAVSRDCCADATCCGNTTVWMTSSIDPIHGYSSIGLSAIYACELFFFGLYTHANYFFFELYTHANYFFLFLYTCANYFFFNPTRQILSSLSRHSLCAFAPYKLAAP
jgi:hypothetical protein